MKLPCKMYRSVQSYFSCRERGVRAETFVSYTPTSPGCAWLRARVRMAPAADADASAETLKNRLSLRTTNCSPKRLDAAELKSLDSSIKKVTPFLKKVKERLGEEARAQLLAELARLNLSKYVDEVALGVAEAKLKLSDVPAATEVCSAMHVAYAAFMPALLPLLCKNATLLPPPAVKPGAPPVAAETDAERSARLFRKRATLRLLFELVAVGALDAAPVLSCFEEVIREDLPPNLRAEIVMPNLAVVASLSKHLLKDPLLIEVCPARPPPPAPPRLGAAAYRVVRWCTHLRRAFGWVWPWHRPGRRGGRATAAFASAAAVTAAAAALAAAALAAAAASERGGLSSDARMHASCWALLAGQGTSRDRGRWRGRRCRGWRESGRVRAEHAVGEGAGRVAGALSSLPRGGLWRVAGGVHAPAGRRACEPEGALEQRSRARRHCRNAQRPALRRPARSFASSSPPSAQPPSALAPVQAVNRVVLPLPSSQPLRLPGMGTWGTRGRVHGAARPIAARARLRSGRFGLARAAHAHEPARISHVRPRVRTRRWAAQAS